MIEAAGPLSNGVQVGLRVPAILIGLVGVVLILIFMRRLGTGAALLGAAGSFLLAADQGLGIAWILHNSSMTSSSNFDEQHFYTINNVYTYVDVALMTIGIALVVIAIVVRRPGQPAASQASSVNQPGQMFQPGQQFSAPSSSPSYSPQRVFPTTSPTAPAPTSFGSDVDTAPPTQP